MAALPKKEACANRLEEGIEEERDEAEDIQTKDCLVISSRGPTYTGRKGYKLLWNKYLKASLWILRFL